MSCLAEGEKLPFSKNEMNSRINKIRNEMVKRGVDCLIAQSPYHFYYVSGSPLFPFGRPCAVILPLEGEPTIIEAIQDLNHTHVQSYITDILTYWDLDRPPLDSVYLLMKKVLEEKGLEKSCIGFEDESVPYYFYNKFNKTFPEAKFVGISDLLHILRMVKSEEELNYIRIGSEISDFGMEKFFEIIEPKKLVYDIRKECCQAMELEIMRKYPYAPYIVNCGGSAGPVSGRATKVFPRISKASGHSPWSTSDLKATVEEGLGMCVSDVKLWGYWANVERNFILGKLTPEVKKPFEVMIEMHNATLDLMKPGNRIPDVDWMAKSILMKYGYSRYNYGSGCGRGIINYGGSQTGGRELRSDLRIYNDYEFKPGMVFSLEPELMVPEVGIFRHCSTIIITAKGHEVWSKIPYDLIIK
jgi:creatinase